MKTQTLRCLSLPMLAAVLLAVPGASAEPQSQTSITPQAAFEELKGLSGEWRGTEGEKNKGQPATVTYRTTSGGSTVVETLFPGSEHEMVTMYHLDGDKLVLTHYCALANQPKMALTGKSTADELVFDFAGGSNVKKKDMHMHSMRLRFENKDSIATEWDMFNEGKKVESKKFFLTRKS